jgi:hypothetical protein
MRRRQMIGTRHSAECGDQTADLLRFLFGRDLAGLEVLDQVHRQPGAVGHFLRRQLRLDSRGIQLLT